MTLPRGLFITGTDTGVGKTRVACEIVRSLVAEGRQVGVLKPVSTGGTEDARELIIAQGENLPLALVNPIQLAEPLAPPIAARRAGMILRFADVISAVRPSLETFSYQAEVLIVEGAGGLFCPLAEETTMADLASWLDYPILIVARRGLGTINHILLTLHAAQSGGLRIAGVILNGCDPTHNRLAEETAAEELSRRMGSVAILDEIEHGSMFESLRHLDWLSRSATPRNDFRTWRDSVVGDTVESGRPLPPLESER